MNRREFLSSGLVLGFGIILENALGTPKVMAKALNESELNEPEEKRLDTPFNGFLSSIQTEKLRLISIIESRDLFSDFKNLTREQQVEDFEMYFPIYSAAEQQYGVPWYLLWIIHLQETFDSRFPTPEINGYVGAMQRHPGYYPDSVAEEAVVGWEFLEELPQRYLKKTGSRTNDYEEMMFAAKKLEDDALEIQLKNGLSAEEAILKALYRYSAARFAAQREQKYRELKLILGPVERVKTSSRGTERLVWEDTSSQETTVEPE